MKSTASKLACAVAMAFVAVGTSNAARAQTDDHLKCYQIRDPLQLQGIVDLDSVQFGLEPGCTISRAKLFCVPATKKVREAFDVGARPPAPIDLLGVVGPPAPGDRICYTIRCPRPFPPDQRVTDQFGSRTVRQLVPRLLCTPAVKGPLSCDLTAPRQCGGDCPDPQDRCLPDPLDRGCVCVSPPVPCGSTLAPQCEGACPETNQVCQPVPGTDNCRCEPPAPLSCERAGGPQCDGECTVGLICVSTPGTTLCGCKDAVPQACDGTAPLCNGACPADRRCRSSALGCYCE